MSPTIRRAAAVLSALAAVGACSGTEPTSGQFYLGLSGPAPARAIQLRLIGRLNGLVSAAGVRFFVDTLAVDTVMIMAVAAQGQTLPSASASLTVGQFSVPDTRGLYQAQLLQVAAPDYSQQNPFAYVLEIRTAP